MADERSGASLVARATAYGKQLADRFEDQFVVRCLRRYSAITGTDRAMSIGAHVFSTLIPIAIVFTAALSSSKTGSPLADKVIQKYRLTGPAAEAAQALLTHAPATEGVVATILGVVIVLFSGVSFTRALQRAYEAAWGLASSGLRKYVFGLAGVAVLLVDAALLIAIAKILHGGAAGSVAWLARFVANLVAWWVLQWLLLSRRVHWRLLLPGAVLSAVGATIANAVSGLVMPRIMTTNAVKYGAIGITFALLTWFLVLAVVLVAGAVVSAEAGGAPQVTRASLARIEAAAAEAEEGAQTVGASGPHAAATPDSGSAEARPSGDGYPARDGTPRG